jgi:hypothetical protein
MFAKLTSAIMVPVYIGIADDLSNRVPSHEHWDAAVALGATHVLAHLEANATRRKLEEQDLIATFQPPLNLQHRRPATKTLGGLG